MPGNRGAGRSVPPSARPLPADAVSAMRLLDAMLKATSPIGRLGVESAWPGSALAGARSAVAPGGAGAPAARAGEVLPKGAVRIGSAIITASALLQELQYLQERAQVEAAIARFHFDRTNATHILSARAYVWGRNFAPLWFWEVPFSGPVNEHVAQTIGRFERDNPGTLGAVTHGDPAARQALTLLVRGAVGGKGILAPIAVEKRTSAVDSALSSDSSVARKALGIQNNRSWVAHHLITFSGVAGLPVKTQQAIVASGWRMDLAENLMALPANLAAYLAQMTPIPRPYHSGRHPRYNMRVDAALVGIRVRTLEQHRLRAWLLIQESFLRTYVMAVGGQGLLK